jgi:hypothetical protein
LNPTRGVCPYIPNKQLGEMMKILNFIVLVCFLTGFATLNSCSENEKEEIFVQMPSQQIGVPTVTTCVKSVTATSAIAEGNVTNEGAAFVTERGIEISSRGRFRKLKYWGAGTGKFTLEITGLWPGKAYSVRAYAINAAGKAYGDVISLYTHEPVVTTDLVTVLSQTAAIVVGSVTRIYSGDLSERGICYGTAPTPTTEGIRVISTNEVGKFTCNLQNLIPGTHYYVRAYVSGYWAEDIWNDPCISSFYGDKISFTTLGLGSIP